MIDQTEPTKKNALAVMPPPSRASMPLNADPVNVFSTGGFEVAQRMATALMKSNLIPTAFQNNLPNCIIALEMASRIGASPMAVMQNIYVVHGKPAWSAQFVIAAINCTGRFSPLRFDVKGEGDKRECTAWAIELATKERLEGPPVSIAMAKAEGWFGKNGSKWQTMPELMMRYRAATFFGRIYAPEVLMGMKEEGEIIDVEAQVIDESPVIARPVIGAAGNATLVEPDVEPKPEKKTRGKKAAEPSVPGTTEEPPPTAPPPENSSPSAVNPTLEDQVLQKLSENGYSADELVKVAISANWCETTTKTIAGIGDEKLAMFLEPEQWEMVVGELEAERAKK